MILLAVPVSMCCLRVGGRFLEIGKRDIYGNSQIGLRPFKNSLTFVSIDLARQLVTRLGNMARFDEDWLSLRRRLGQSLHQARDIGHKGMRAVQQAQPGQPRPQRRHNS